MAALLDADPILYYLSGSALLKMALVALRGRSIPGNAELVGKVTELRVHPVKGTHPVPVTQATCSFNGIRHGNITDRQWMVTFDNYSFVTAAHEPTITTIKPSFQGDNLVLDAPGMETLSVSPQSVEAAGIKVDTKVHGAAAVGLDCGQKAADWLTKFFGGKAESGYRLLYSPLDMHNRDVRTGSIKHKRWTTAAKTEDRVAFHDVTAAHLITQQSLIAVNNKMADTDHVTMDFFRPNIICTATKPFDEDTWKEIYIGDSKFCTLKLCGRCPRINVDPANGKKRENEEPLATLNSFRTLIPINGYGPCLGIQMVTDWEGSIRVGDPIYVIRGDNTVLP